VRPTVHRATVHGASDGARVLPLRGVSPRAGGRSRRAQGEVADPVAADV